MSTTPLTGGGARSNAGLLHRLEEARVQNAWDPAELADNLAWKLYAPLVREHRQWLPHAHHARLDEEVRVLSAPEAAAE